MYRGTTPTVTFSFSDTDPTLAVEIIATLARQGRTLMEKTGSDLTVTETSVSFKLTQEESLSMQQGKVAVQLNMLFPDGNRGATKIKYIDWEKNLHEEVMQ